MILQFALLLLASEVLTAWKEEERMDVDKADPTGRRGTAPLWFRTMTSLASGVGGVSLLAQGLVLRFVFPIAVGNLRAHHVPDADMGSHDPLISTVGYGQLQTVIPADAVVQFNPRRTRDFHSIVDVMQINHQLAMSDDRGGCGSDLGGDPSGCPAMAAAVDSVYKGTTAARAREVCGEYGIQYLVARVYDPAWKDVNSWVWTLPAVVEDPEFRALDCR